MAIFVAAGVLDAAGLKYDVPNGWVAGTPHSSMRVAEFTLPRAAGDGEDADLVVYYFGGQGGSVDANIERWASQIQPSESGGSKPVRREQRTVHGMAVTLIDLTGRYVAETAPGSAQHVDKADFRLRAGVVQTPNGPYFIKLTGPRRTVARWEPAFDSFVGSLRYEGGSADKN